MGLFDFLKIFQNRRLKQIDLLSNGFSQGLVNKINKERIAAAEKALKKAEAENDEKKIIEAKKELSKKRKDYIKSYKKTQKIDNEYYDIDLDWR